jgi:UDP-N-acetyl-2-amino-2-deoxyglucuronate dehydrogenase
MKDRLGIGIIGVGSIFRRHATAYQCLPELAERVAVADIDLGRAQSAKGKFGFQHAFQDYHDLLSRADVDAVSICTPPNRHAQIAIDAINAGKHVLCEKPLAHTLSDADRITQAAENHPGVVVSCVYQNRTDPPCARTQYLIGKDHVGKLLAANVQVFSQRPRSYYAAVPTRGTWKADGGGVLINQAVHQLDLLVYLLGRPVQVAAVMDTFLQPIEAEDTLAGWVKFENGAFATILCTVCAQKDEGYRLVLLGENAAFTIRKDPDAQHASWEITANSQAALTGLRRDALHRYPPDPSPGNLTLLRQKVLCKLRGKTWLPPRDWGHTPHIREFLEAVRRGGPAPVGPAQARLSLDLAVGLYQSATTRQPVSLPLDPGSPFYAGVDPAQLSVSV